MRFHFFQNGRIFKSIQTTNQIRIIQKIKIMYHKKNVNHEIMCENSTKVE